MKNLRVGCGLMRDFSEPCSPIPAPPHFVLRQPAKHMRNTTRSLRCNVRRGAHSGVFVVALLISSAQGFALLTAPAKNRLLDAIESGKSDAEIAQCAASLERFPRLSGTTTSDLLPGNWLMVFTTSETIAGKKRPELLQVRTPPEQSIDVEKGRAQNSESIFGITNAVDIALQPATRNRVDVRFEKFILGPISFPAPKELTGSLTTTYLDEELRISRGDRDNLFVLLRESNMREKANIVWDGWRQSW